MERCEGSERRDSDSSTCRGQSLSHHKDEDPKSDES